MSNTTNTTTTATTATTNTTATKKVDFFQSAKTLSARTSKFFRVVIKKAELNAIYSERIAANETSIASINDMLSRGTDLNVTVEELEKMRENYVTINEALKNEWEKLLKEQATFEFTEDDKAFKKALKSASSQEDVIKAVRVFFKGYKLEVANTTFEAAILESIGKKVDVKTIVKSNGTKALSYDANNALKNLYGVSFEAMVEAGTIKAADIPSVLAKKYEKKSKKN
jgi:hypothetical protein